MKTDMKFIRHSSRRPALSELLGAVLSIAITLTAGAAVFGFASAQAVRSESQIGNGAQASVGFLQERFVLFDLSFGTPTQVTAWLYNSGQIQLQPVQVRLYDSAGLVNLLFNYTTTGSTKTDFVFDLRSTLASKCKTAAASYENPVVSRIVVKSTTVQTLALTIPPQQSSCPSFGRTFQAGTTYVVSLLGAYGNSGSYSQTR